ncbi:MAG: hypothetical protein HY880_08655, partial [Deltaproteobacteria bacterium]|nr:hypothetical protein [Deltaproteobacteria bacterium]
MVEQFERLAEGVSRLLESHASLEERNRLLEELLAKKEAEVDELRQMLGSL